MDDDQLCKWGKAAWQFGKFEATRVWGTVWPLALSGVVVYLTDRSTELTEAGQVTVGIIVAAVAKILQQWAANNTGRRL